MPRKKRGPESRLPKKVCWHLYDLQALQPGKFIKVIGKVLKKEYMLIK